MGGKSVRSEADEATRGAAIKLAAELSSRLLTFATTWLIGRALGVADFGRYTLLATCAVLLAELGELGLQNLASRALVAGTHSLRSLARARLLASALLGLVALAAVPLAPVVAARLGVESLDGPALALGAGLSGVAVALALSPLPVLVLGLVLLRGRPGPRTAAERSPLGVLRDGAPLAVHGGLLLLSPRVEFLVLSAFASDTVTGSFAAALLFVWPLALVPSAVIAGAMPALTREALHGGDAVRRRTAATAGALAAPAAVGLALVAPALMRTLLGPGYEAAGGLLRLLAASLPAAFLNALVAGALIAAGRAAWLPRLTAGRVVVALALAFVLVPRLGATGAAAGLVCAEWALLAAGRLACRRAGFPVPAAGAIGWGLVACVPMALAVGSVRASLPLALALGALTWVATLAAAARLAPSRLRQLTGDLRYPWAP